MMTTRRFLFSTLSGHGHLNPLIPLARALQARGHEVAFAARDIVQPRVEAAGFRFFPVGSDRNLDPEYQAFKPVQDAMPLGIESELVIYTRLFCGIAPRLMTPGLVQVGQTWQPQVIIREAGEYGALIAAEYLGLPHVVVSFAAALKSVLMLEARAAEGLDPIRQFWGLPPDPDLTAIYRYLHLVYSPPTFAAHDVTGDTPSFPIPPNTHFIRPQIFDNTANETLPDWVNHLPDQPTVYVTMGTEVNKLPELYPSVLQTIIEGLRDLPYNLIVTLGRDKDPADFGAQPPNVHIERYIPQSLLLPHVDLMVMHGGSNSLLAALDVALPLVIIPLIADQFFNAYVTEKMGLGRVVARDDLTPSAIRAAVEHVLHNPAYRQTAHRLQAEMHNLPDQNHAVELVERLAVESL
jgi:MGT family glycosyltransferase